MERSAQPAFRRCLVVDDDQIIHFLLSTLISGDGWEMACACSGEEGVELNRSFQPDIILMDIEMRGMSGLEAAKMIREESGQSTPVIIGFTNARSPKIRDACLEAGMNDFIEKPFSAETILGVLHRFGMANDSLFAPAFMS